MQGEVDSLFSLYVSLSLSSFPKDVHGFGSLMNKLQLALAPDGYTNDDVVKSAPSFLFSMPSFLHSSSNRNASMAATKRKENKLKRYQLKVRTSLCSVYLSLCLCFTSLLRWLKSRELREETRQNSPEDLNLTRLA
jgi:hypothetical protein